MGDAQWLDERQSHVWRAYLRLNQELYARLEERLAQHAGLSRPDYQVLVVLSEAPGQAVRARELGAELRWDRSRLSHHLRRMERRGQVTRESCAEDGRGSVVRLTPAGRKAIEDAAPQHVGDVRRYFLDLVSPLELATLSTVFDRLLANLAEPERQSGRTVIRH